MFQATKGVNTHKGIIFSLGIACAAVGVLKQQGKRPTMMRICKTVAAITENIIEIDFKEIDSKPLAELTYGEKLYLHYGFTGIRGEVASGFETVQRETFQILRGFKKEIDLELNDLLLEVLLRLMQSAEDTNLVTRGGLDGLVFAKRQAREFIEAGGMKQEQAHEKLSAMNRLFCDKRLSPGGSADLLSVAVFLAMNEGIL
jgi:triphosphoribosyl-dephospho-CoA synthase